MRKNPLASEISTINSTKNAASSVLNTIMTTIAAAAKSLAPHKKHPFFKKKIKGLVVASLDTADWAVRVRNHFMMEFSSLYHKTNLEIETIIVQGGIGEMQSALLKHSSIAGRHKKRFSFVITPGYAESMMFNEVRSALGLTLKQLYCVQGAMTAPFRVLRDGIAGVHNVPMHPQEYLDSLRALIPNLKKVCIAASPYVEQEDENDAIQRQRKALSEIFTKNNIEVVEHLWDEHSYYPRDLALKVAASDVLITLDENAMYNHRSGVIDLCNQLKKPLCASELDSVFAGAALGCGITRDAFAKPLLSVLHDMMFPQQRLVSSVEIPMQVGMRYNLNAIALQGIVVSEEAAALMRMKSIYDLDIITL